MEGREGAEEDGGRRERVDGGNAVRGADRGDLDGGCLLCGGAEGAGAALVAKAVTRKQGGKERRGGGREGRRGGCSDLPFHYAGKSAPWNSDAHIDT